MCRLTDCESQEYAARKPRKANGPRSPNLRPLIDRVISTALDKPDITTARVRCQREAPTSRTVLLCL